MKCGVPTSAYACSNAAGTTCTKVAFTAINLSANTTCAASEFVILSQPEYASLSASVTSSTSANGTQTASITSLQTDVNLLKAWSGVGSSVPNTDVLAAQSVLFAATFATLAVVWGVRRVFDQFKVAHE